MREFRVAVMVNDLQVARERKGFYSATGIKLSDGSGTEGASPVNEIYIRDPVITFLVPEAHERIKADGIWVSSRSTCGT